MASLGPRRTEQQDKNSAIGTIQRQQFQELAISHKFQVALEKSFAEFFGTSKIQIHQQKGNLRSEIAAAQPGAELDAVEDLNAFRSEANMLAVEVTMHIANPTLFHPPHQQMLVPLNKFRTEILEYSGRFNINYISQKRLKVCQIFIPLLLHLFDIMGGVDMANSFGLAMKTCEQLCQLDHHFRCDLLGFQENREHAPVRKSPHDEDILGQLFLASQLPDVSIHCYRHNP